MAYAGIYYEEASNSPVVRVKSGYGGLWYELPADFIPVKVVDYQGIGIPNVLVTAKNLGGDFATRTDDLGNTAIQIDADANIELQKDQQSMTFEYQDTGQVTIEFDLQITPY